MLTNFNLRFLIINSYYFIIQTLIQVIMFNFVFNLFFYFIFIQFVKLKLFIIFILPFSNYLIFKKDLFYIHFYQNIIAISHYFIILVNYLIIFYFLFIIFPLSIIQLIVNYYYYINCIQFYKTYKKFINFTFIIN